MQGINDINSASKGQLKPSQSTFSFFLSFFSFLFFSFLKKEKKVFFI